MKKYKAIFYIGINKIGELEGLEGKDKNEALQNLMQTFTYKKFCKHADEMERTLMWEIDEVE